MDKLIVYAFICGISVVCPLLGLLLVYLADKYL